MVHGGRTGYTVQLLMLPLDAMRQARKSSMYSVAGNNLLCFWANLTAIVKISSKFLLLLYEAH